MIQVKVERTGTDPVEAKISIRSSVDGPVQEQMVTDIAQATAMTDALENCPAPTEDDPGATVDKLGVWRGPGI